MWKINGIGISAGNEVRACRYLEWMTIVCEFMQISLENAFFAYSRI